MLVKMKRHMFYSSDYATLGWTCIEPTIRQIKGKSFTVKSDAYKQLTAGQRALLLFWVLYGHARTMPEFYGIVYYYMLELKVWPEVKSRMKYFENDAMLQIYEEIEQVIEARNKDLERNKSEISISDLGDDPKLYSTFVGIYKRYQENIPGCIERIGLYMRNNPHEFVLIEE